MQVSLEVFSLTPSTICLQYRARAPLGGVEPAARAQTLVRPCSGAAHRFLLLSTYSHRFS